jgi:hypothetical protein
MKRNLNILLILCILLTTASVGVYVYLFKKINQFKSDVVVINQKILTEEANLKNLETAEKNLKTIVDEGDKLATLYIDHENIVDFIQMVESLIKKGNLIGQVVSVSDVASQDLDYMNKEKLMLVINAKGDWLDVYKLVGLLEKLPYKASVENVGLTYSRKDKIINAPDSKVEFAPKEVWETNIKMYVWAKKSKVKNSTTPTIK